MMRKCSTIALMLLTACLWAATARAQVTTATVYGLVTDNTDAVLPGADATLTNESTAAVVTAVSNERGEFTLTFVPVGVYTLKVTLSGFGDYQQQHLALSAGQAVRLTTPLAVSGQTDTISVTAEAPLINRANAQQQQTLSGDQQLRELPLSGRDWSKAVSLDNGVTTAGNGGITMNGLPPAGMSLTVDGTNGSSDPELPSVGAYQGFNTINTVSTEAIEQISVSKGIASAEFGGTMSGNVNIITRGGSNTFHGSVFENNQSDAYDATNPFVSTTPKKKYNQFGGAIGGPVLRNRLFFFGTFERVRSQQQAPVAGDVPTPEFKASVLAVNPVYKALFALYPDPTAPYAAGAQTGRYSATRPSSRDDENITARGDLNLSTSNRLNGRYSRGRPQRVQARVVEAANRTYDGTQNSATLTFTHAAASWVSETRFGYNDVSITRVDGLYSVDTPSVSVVGTATGDGEYFAKDGTVVSLDHVMASTRGRHSLKAGFNYLRQTSGRDNLEVPTYSYSSLADFLVNVPSSVRFTFGLREFQLRTTQFGGFLQDDIRLGAKLVLNAGVRYDYFTVPDERDGRLFNRDDPFGTGPLRPADSIYKGDRNNFSPRVGFAYTIDDATVVRGGVGVFVNPHPLFGGPVDLVLNSVDEQFRVTISRQDALKYGIGYPTTNAQAAPLVQGASALWGNRSISPDFPNPYSTQWTATVERQFGSDYSVEAAYVGNKTENLNTVSQINRPDRVTGVRPYAGFAEFSYYDAKNSSKYNSLQLSMRRRFANRYAYGVAYTLGKNTSYGSGDLLLETNPQETGDIAAEYGPTPWDIRHRFVANFLYEVPPFGSNAVVKAVASGWQVSGIYTALSGAAFNVTDGGSSYTLSRPDYAGGSLVTSDWDTTLQYLNRDAFARVPIVTASGAQARPGTLGRNAVRGPASYNLDLGISKNIYFGGAYRLQIRADAFNALNTKNYSGLTTNIASGTFGRLTAVSTRTMQIGARFSF
jgi:outer membrane receptor protein involved in Fe transport